jgi:catechol 2,3-dioxygenase-like lactoylglutathione lyase family enzyme
VTDGTGFGHVVFATTAFDASHRFVTEGLGLRQTDWLETEIAAGIELEIRFYHCNPRHHSLALVRAPFDLPQQLHHFMIEVADRDDVGYAFDRAWKAGCTIASGLGQHPNDQMFSFYVALPAGFQVEVGHGARLVTELGREPPLRPHQHLGPPATPTTARSTSGRRLSAPVACGGTAKRSPVTEPDVDPPGSGWCNYDEGQVGPRPSHGGECGI